jgi:hypothetical protein
MEVPTAETSMALSCIMIPQLRLIYAYHRQLSSHRDYGALLAYTYTVLCTAVA